VHAQCLALGFTTLEAVLWISTKPIYVVTSQYLYSELGVSARFIQVSSFVGRFDTWQSTGTAVIWIAALAVLLLLLDNLVTRRHLHDAPPGKEKSTFGRRARKNLW
jgi:hypothetical protein